jgi:hypothetical protein
MTVRRLVSVELSVECLAAIFQARMSRAKFVVADHISEGKRAWLPPQERLYVDRNLARTFGTVVAPRA